MGVISSKKLYVAYKPCKEPVLGTGKLLSYFEDEVGYFILSGEMELDIDDE